MRRILSFIFAGVLITTACVSTARAAGRKSTLKDKARVSVYVDGVDADPYRLSFYEEDELYVPLESVSREMGSYFYTWNSALRTASLMAEDMFLTVNTDSGVMETSRGNYTMNYGVQIKEGVAMVPAQKLCDAFGAKLTVADGRAEIDTAVVTADTAVAVQETVSTADDTADMPYYEEDYTDVSYTESYSADTDDLYWLSHIIYAEAGGESYEGMVAVGNVVLNRVRSDSFPNTIYDVIFQSGQFEPVDNGSVYLEPSSDAISAAEDAIAGMNVVGDALYFNMSELASWASRNRPFITQIGCHNFYA